MQHFLPDISLLRLRGPSISVGTVEELGLGGERKYKVNQRPGIGKRVLLFVAFQGILVVCRRVLAKGNELVSALSIKN